MDATEEDESPCSSSSNLFDDIPNVMAMQGAFADDKDVAAFVGEESGFDAFNGEHFDIIQFVTDNADDTPLDSPVNGNYYLNNCAMQHQAHPTTQLPNQQQQMIHQQNLNNNGINGLRAPILLDNGLMYGNGAGVGNGQTRLPDSPPITDISASGSSASPSSGSDSPFSPENYRNYHNINPNNHPNGVLMTMQMPQNNHQSNDPMMTDQLVNQMHHRQQQQQRQILQQQQVSPQSEFLSPYPPSQSTPGSHSQVSPPAISNQRRSCGSSNGCDDCQPISYMQNVTQSYDPRMDMYSTNSANDMGAENIQRQQAGQKRRRIVPDAPAAGGNLPNVKCELNGNGAAKSAGQKFGSQPNGNTRSYPATPASQQSFDDYDEQGLQRTIKFTSFVPETWCPLYDCNHRELPQLNVAVVADKGFNYSLQDNCFVNQKKNHFQITASISRNANSEPPYFVRLPNGELQPISEFMLAFCGVKHEMPSSEIQIRQSQTDRKPVPHEAVRFPVDHSMRTKQTVPRLHFSETTLNNHRKGGKPNPEQRFFLLVVKLLVNTPIGPVLVQAYQSDRVIVRVWKASNPGQFTEPESDVSWQRANGNVLTFSGQVAIGTDKPIQDAQLTVLGNVVTSGQITRPSDRRVKEDIADMDPRDAMSRVNQMRIVEYAYKPEVAKQWGLTEENRHRVGVIAQELAEVLPDAVRDNGEFLTVDDTRIFYDTVAAAQELYRLTGNLECKIDQVEKISQKLARFAQKRKNHMGSMASGISDFSNLFGTSLGGDNKSYISYSRTSLASNGGCEESHERRKRSDDSSKGHRRCRSSASYCQRGDQALCTSKITQGTIVALVVVMALCLMAMCTLYVLDWYNRTYVYFPHHHYGYPHIVSPTPAHPMNLDDGIGHFKKKLDKDKIPYAWTPPLDSKAPPLAVICGQRNQCPTFCCANHLSYSSKDGGNQGDESTFLELAGQSNAKGKLDLTSQAVFSTAEQLESGVQIQVLNLNATLDQRYCVTEGACNARKGRYNLYVPISDHLPTIPLQLKFSVEDGLFVDNCGILLDFDHKSCQMDIDNGLDGDKDKVTNSRKDRKKAPGRSIRPVSNRVTENIFEVSVGGFLQSAFRFRIGHTTESCNMAEDQQGRSFDEYNLVFYRSCLVNALRASKVIAD